METLTLHHGALAFTTLSAGRRTPETVPVLCLHGFPDHAWTFKPQLQALSKAGFWALAPMMRGYEPTSQPQNNDYSLIAMAHDVLAWLDELDIERAHLVGHDWGAAVGYTVCGLAPERFATLTTIAVPHSARMVEALPQVPSQLLKSWYMLFFQTGPLARWAVAAGDWALVRWLWKRWSPSYTLSSHQWQALRQTFNAPGVRQAMLAYYRQNASPDIMLGLRTPKAMTLKRIDVPTLAITGQQDGTIDTQLHELTLRPDDFPAGVRIERLSGAGHFAHLEAPQEVNALILEWIGGA